ncbi:MAG: AAA family ATPase [Anaerolineae bacterium]|nr:AAA family ATPase [Anaerolineae bacterium]
MIESITIANTATYTGPAQVLSGLSEFNYVFGSNGTGKTTIGRIIANEQDFPDSFVAWRGGTRLPTMVYNRDFVERNFDQSPELPGVFTLGEQQVDTLAKLAEAVAERDRLESSIQELKQRLNGAVGNAGKRGELANHRERLAEDSWKIKLRFDGKPTLEAFRGHLGSKVSFRDKLLHEEASNTSELLSIERIEKKSESLFGLALERETLIVVQGIPDLLAHEVNPLLMKCIIGKDDVDIAEMIKTLGNSDWVRAGKTFYDVNARLCPFCQQETSEAFANSLEEYFDETFAADSIAIDDLVAAYESDGTRLLQSISSLLSTQSSFLDVAALRAQKDLLDAKITINKQILASKKHEPSQKVELESAQKILTSVKTLIDSANTQIELHNKMVENYSQEKKLLVSQVWKYAVEELRPILATYHAAEVGLVKAITKDELKLGETEKEREKKDKAISELEKQTTSVQPTVDKINSLLSKFGFNSFKLTRTSSGKSYKLVRADGSDARTTLSEGERSFITFLYFYHLLSGSDSDTGVTSDRVVVFDDPVSSLDSNTLFIVSTLIKKLISDIANGSGRIKQVIVMTHNVYFHKEITYCGNREQKIKNRQRYWIVKKSGFVSKIEQSPRNPIRTSYDLLWAEVRNPERANLSIQNTLRRILESYFKLLGRIDLDQLIDKFEGHDKFAVRELVSWVHDGSHNDHDPLFCSNDELMVARYLDVFRRIFESLGQTGHYEMMMHECAGPGSAIAAAGIAPIGPT